MNIQQKQDIINKWQEYFPKQEMPIAVFYADTLHGAEYVKKPADNPRGYTCMFAQLAKAAIEREQSGARSGSAEREQARPKVMVHRGEAVAFDKDNLGCWGAIENLFGGPFVEDATVRLLVEIEKFKADREQVLALNRINPKAEQTGKYIIFKPVELLTGEDVPEIFCIFAKPDVIAALHTLVSFDNTRIDNVIVPFGSGCEQAFKFAFSEAKKENPRAVLGTMDVAMRGCMKHDRQTFSVAAATFYNMVMNMDKSFLNTYIWQGLKRRLNK